KHPIVPLIMDFRHLSKVVDTYLHPETGLVAYADSKGFIHATMQQSGAVTFRFSCSTPNLQNVPTRSKLGKRIRAGFKAPPGMDMCVADFSMFELIMMANFCRDPLMSMILSDPCGDMHSATAAKV